MIIGPQNLEYFIYYRRCEQLAEFIDRHISIIVLFIFSLIMDALTTTVFMGEHGIDSEINRIVVLCCYGYGHVSGPFVAAFIKVSAASVIVRLAGRYAYHLISLCTVSYVFAAAYNTWAVELYVRNVVPWLPF